MGVLAIPRLTSESVGRRREAAEELAFVKAAAAEGIQDVEAAWKLCDRDAVDMGRGRR